jgi:hypothetical protein
MGAFFKLLKIKLIKSTVIESRHSHQIQESTRFMRVFLCLRIFVILSYRFALFLGNGLFSYIDKTNYLTLFSRDPKLTNVS